MNEEEKKQLAEMEKNTRIEKLAKLLRMLIYEVYEKELEELNNEEVGELFEGWKVIQKWLEDKLFMI